MIEHKGHKIFVRDFSHLGGNEIAELNTQMTEEMLRRDYRGALLLINITGCTFDKESIARIKSDVARSNEHLSKTAVIGVTGILRVFVRNILKFFTNDAKICATEAEALDWLISEK